MSDTRAIDAKARGVRSLWQRGVGGLRDLQRLPPRVQALVDAELQRADILAAWIGFAVAAFLGVLYLVSPKALDAMGRLEPVPVAVGLFLLVGVVRLRMAHAGALGRRAAIVFVVLDFALLYGLIWTFHLQYGQPAAFYLKAPTFLFVFLLIAVRALRFELAPVLAAGLSAALGWALMAVIAVATTPPPAVTRDFVAYMTGSVVLVGAEVEKILAILLVTGVLALAILRSRRQLVLAAAGATAKDDLSRFFAPEIAARITSDDEILKPGFGEVRSAAILIADIRGFTALAARRRPIEVMQLLVDYQRRISRVVTAHGGAIDKFLGDGVLATFGCARPSETPAADALRTLMALLDEAEDFRGRQAAALGEDVVIGFAVTSGEVLCGTVGDPARLEFTVIGDAVNRAAKLEKLNKTLATAALVPCETLDAATMQGFSPEPRRSPRCLKVALPGAVAPLDVAAWPRPAAG